MRDLANRVIFHSKLYAHLVSFHFQSRLAYRFDFFMSVVSVSVEMVVRLIFLSVIYSFVPTLAGWTYPQMLFLFATAFILDAISWFTWRAGIMKLHIIIQDGSFDFLLTKPANLLFLTAFRRMDFEDVARLVLGIGLLIKAIQLSSETPSLHQWITWILALCLAQVVFFSFGLLLKLTSFWSTQTSEINYIMYSFDRLNQYPVQMYHGFLRFFFTFIIPVAFVTTIPTQLLTGTASGWLIFGLAIFSVLFFLLAKRAFYAAIRAYSSASS